MAFDWMECQGFVLVCYFYFRQYAWPTALRVCLAVVHADLKIFMSTWKLRCDSTDCV